MSSLTVSPNSRNPEVFSASTPLFAAYYSKSLKHCSKEELEKMFIDEIINHGDGAPKATWELLRRGKLLDYMVEIDSNAILDWLEQEPSIVSLVDNRKRNFNDWLKKNRQELQDPNKPRFLSENVQVIEKWVHNGVNEWCLSSLEKAAEKIEKLYLSRPSLSFDHFKPLWKKADRCVHKKSAFEQEQKIVSFVRDALIRIESKMFLSLIIRDLNIQSKEYKELTERIHLIYTDQSSLLPTSPKGYQSEWERAKKLTCDYPESTQRREYALQVITSRESELNKGYSASECDINDWDDGFM